MPTTDERVVTLLRERGVLTQGDISELCHVPYHQCAQVMRRVAKTASDVRYANGALYLDV